jgi:hypothetical protein
MGTQSGCGVRGSHDRQDTPTRPDSGSGIAVVTVEVDVAGQPGAPVQAMNQAIAMNWQTAAAQT